MGVFGRSKSTSVAPDEVPIIEGSEANGQEPPQSNEGEEVEVVGGENEGGEDDGSSLNFKLPKRTTPYSTITVTRPELACKQNIYTRQLKEAKKDGPASGCATGTAESRKRARSES